MNNNVKFQRKPWAVPAVKRIDAQGAEGAMQNSMGDGASNRGS